MQTSIIVAFGAAALIASTAFAQDSDQTPPTKAELALAKRLEGRVAGDPVSCITAYPTTRAQVYDRVAIVWEHGDVLYVNRPANGAHALNDRDIMVQRRTTSQLCSVDTIEMRDNIGFFTGTVFLDQFVPYYRSDAG
ncbi:hypothetical protein RM533_04280 [Croceicoccus sp. F390]|uniref:Uncharacterized protein n=1 Tax=Croceicoccus esteveae TaxID=3075597 RepID=A0ABU2ZFN9_9SPHN|nr:hypothetical protein [Croceicoccus sp. F390]MDT0575398.1 hypothetical protein [Croceicoccus sp. F390]